MHLATTRRQLNHRSGVLRFTRICHLQKPPESHLQAMLLWKDFVKLRNTLPSIVHTNVVKEIAVIDRHSIRTSCDTTCRWTLQCHSVHDQPTALLRRRPQPHTIPSASWLNLCAWARRSETGSGIEDAPTVLPSLRLHQPQHPLQSLNHLSHRRLHRSSLRKQTRARFARVDSNIDNECAASRAATFSTQPVGKATCCVEVATDAVSNAPTAVRGT